MKAWPSTRPGPDLDAQYIPAQPIRGEAGEYRRGIAARQGKNSTRRMVSNAKDFFKGT
jgi:hypothetical protein